MKCVLSALLLFTASYCLGTRTETVTTKEGSLSGWVLDAGSGLSVFRGVRYAEAPRKELRWRPPLPVKPWNGVKFCQLFNPAAPQKLQEGVKQHLSEDCLFLNIWTTKVNKPDAKLPVMVWIHGGGLNRGWSHKEFYDGQGFAKRGAVLVSINYRLGALGFMAHPALSDESENGVSGNYGILDQIEALKWIQKNIAAFGGDPDNVTIFGESAGGTSVAVLCSSPLAKGLFNKAIIQSPWMFGYIDKLTEPNFAYLKKSLVNTPSAEDLGVSWAKAHTDNTGVEGLAILRALPFTKVLEAVDYYQTRPTIDGWVLPSHPQTVFSEGKQANVPIIIGTTKDEGSFFRSFVRFEDRAAFGDMLDDFYGETGESVLKLYPGETKQELKDAGSMFVTDSWFVQPARQMLDGMSQLSSPAFQYRFSKANPSRPELGAPHAIELRYVFNTLTDPEERPADQRLAGQVSDYWVQFAKTGNPNKNGFPHWPEYTTECRAYLDLNDEIITREGLRKNASDVLDAAMAEFY